MQALRHLYALACNKRVMRAVDVNIRQPVYVPVSLAMASNDRPSMPGPGVDRGGENQPSNSQARHSSSQGNSDSQHQKPSAEVPPWSIACTGAVLTGQCFKDSYLRATEAMLGLPAIKGVMHALHSFLSTLAVMRHVVRVQESLGPEVMKSPYPNHTVESRSIGLDGLPTCGHTPAGPTVSTSQQVTVTERLSPCLMPEPDLLRAVQVCRVRQLPESLVSPTCVPMPHRAIGFSLGVLVLQV